MREGGLTEHGGVVCKTRLDAFFWLGRIGREDGAWSRWMRRGLQQVSVVSDGGDTCDATVSSWIDMDVLRLPFALSLALDLLAC